MGIVMNEDYDVYELSEVEKALLKEEVEVPESERERVNQLREDVARLDGYLKGRSDSVRSVIGMARGEGPGKARGKGSNKDLAG
jgi:hypothetical protein